MYCVFLNIIPFLYRLWNGIKLKINNPKTRNKYVDRFLELPFYYLSNTKLKIINLVLTKLRSQILVSIAYTPYQIKRNYTGFKAKE